MKIKRAEIWAIAVLLAVALGIYVWYSGLFAGEQGALYAQITVGGQVVKEMPLQTDGTFALEIRPQMLFEVRDGAIAITHSDCPDQICVHSGFLDRPGQVSVCLPNRVSLIVRSQSTADIDLIAH